MSAPVRGLCGHWERERKAHCDFPVTHRFVVGYRCVLHAPGATEDGCPHNVAWTEPCQPCEKLWAPLAAPAGPGVRSAGHPTRG